MKEYLKEHTALRISLIAVFFIVGMVLIIAGWKMTGKLAGLGIMILGLALLLTALYIYHTPYSD